MKKCLKCAHRFVAQNWDCPACDFSPQRRDRYESFAPDLAEQNDGFREDYFEHLFSTEADYFWFKVRNQLIIWSQQRYFPSAQSFMEVGCGTGFVLSGIQQQLPMLELSGSEIFTKGLQFAEQRLPGVKLYQMDARSIPFDQEFDVIGAFDVIEHIEEDIEVLNQLFQATKPGGGILVTVPQHRFLWGVEDKHSFHKRRYTRQELSKKVEQAGFDVIRTTSFVSFLMPLLMISRLKQRFSKRDFNPLEEINIHPFLNSLFEKIMEIELFMIKCGISLPIGSSLMLVAFRNSGDFSNNASQIK